MEAMSSRDLGPRRLNLPAGCRSLRCCKESMEEHGLGSPSDRIRPESSTIQSFLLPRSCTKTKDIKSIKDKFPSDSLRVVGVFHCSPQLLVG